MLLESLLHLPSLFDLRKLGSDVREVANEVEEGSWVEGFALGESLGGSKKEKGQDSRREKGKEEKREEKER